MTEAVLLRDENRAVGEGELNGSGNDSVEEAVPVARKDVAISKSVALGLWRALLRF